MIKISLKKAIKILTIAGLYESDILLMDLPTFIDKVNKIIGEVDSISLVDIERTINIRTMKKRMIRYFKQGCSKSAIAYILYKEYTYGKINNEEADELLAYLEKFDFPFGIIPEGGEKNE